MSIYTTLNVTRTTAIEVIAAKLELELQRARSGAMGDEELRRRLDEILELQLNNSRVVNDDEPNDDGRVPSVSA